MLDIIKKTALQIVTDAVLPLLSSARWTIIPVQPGVSAFGMAFGRRSADTLGAIAMLLLQDDGSFLPLLVPVGGTPPVFSEHDVREGFVIERRPAYAPRGHAFEPSPVLPERCRLCAEKTLAHEQDALRVHIEHTLKSLEVITTFVEGTTKVASIQVRPLSAEVPIMNPVPGEDKPRPTPKKAPYRALSDKERAALRNILGVEVAA